MLDDGYAAVSTRRVGATAGTDKALVHYYFGTMDALFIALLTAERGNAARSGSAGRWRRRSRCGRCGTRCMNDRARP